MKVTGIYKRSRESDYYNILQKKSLKLIQELAGENWTDFNPSDTGIAILDILNYALYELQYQMQFSFESYISKNAFLSASEVCLPTLVCVSDYENLILNELPFIKHCCISFSRERGYDIEVQVEPKWKEEDVLQSVKNLYHAHRNLGENLGDVKVSTSLVNRPERKTDFPISEISFANRPEVECKPILEKEYHSIQYDFPDCYGLNAKGIPPHINMETKAKIYQLKSYLLIFDFLLANTQNDMSSIAQLAQLSDTFPTKKLHEINMTVQNDLIDFARTENQYAKEEMFLHTQKSNYLDVLDTLYGENTSHFQQREKMIRMFPKLNSERFRASNILQLHPRNKSGVERLFSLLFKDFASTGETFYLVEGNLLATHLEKIAPPVPIYIIFPENAVNTENREKYETFFSERMPVHLAVYIVYLSDTLFYKFQKIYRAWRFIMAKGLAWEQSYHKFKLRCFLSEEIGLLP